MESDARLWDLTPYDLQRQPQLIPENSAQFIQTTGRLLESELRCAICLDILRNTRTTKECLHRFCDECIKQALRNGNKECPNCRKKLVSMRSLRPDPLFDAIIDTIFPNRNEMEEQEAQLLAKIDVLGGGQAQSRKRKADATDKKIAKHAASEAGSSSQASAGPEGEAKVALELSACLEKLTEPKYADVLRKWKAGNRQIRVASHGKMVHVAKFILTRILVDNDALQSTVDGVDGELGQVQLYLRSGQTGLKLLEPNWTLENVQKNLWKNTHPLQICFSFRGSITLK